MLKLKRVDIQGFKSFYDRTDMRFHGSGIAAIVGPNGCGKSNLSDAISWVLGEQSAKSLRGSRMEDVIFAGTRERKPLGMAQVTLTMMNPGGHAILPNEPIDTTPSDQATPAVAADITITRRLYRSGESEYLVNGKSARLRDIQIEVASSKPSGVRERVAPSHCLSFQQVPHSTRLFLDYLYHFDNVRRFFPRAPFSRDWLQDLPG
mgnify:CR=1 FL=1